MSSSEAPADAAAAAAPSAFEMLCAPPALSTMARSPSGHSSVKRVAKLPPLDRLHDVLRREVRIALARRR